MKKIFLVFLMFLCVGCFSPKKHGLSITAAYPFEGRYSSVSEITIDGTKAEVEEKDSLWILSNNTLYNLLTSVSDSTDKIVFGSKTYSIPKKSGKKNSLVEIGRDPFDEEEFVWEDWNTTTNRAETPK